jgi:hypothetical protein
MEWLKIGLKKKQTQTRKENVFLALHSKKIINRIHLFGLSGLDLGTGSRERLFSGKTKLSSVEEKTKTWNKKIRKMEE